MEYRNTILSKRDREDTLKSLVNEKNLNIQFTLSKNEILRIKKLKKPSHQLGYALQFMYLKNKNINIIEYINIIPENLADMEEGKKFIESLKLLLNIPEQLNFATDILVDEKSIFSDKIYSYFPKISMTEILYEVNSWTGVLEYIKENNNSSEKQKALVATLMSNGHNIGFSKMSISSSIEESTLRRTSEYYFNNEALSKAQKNLVNYHHSLDIVKNWGNGENSSSDGMRVPIQKLSTLIIMRIMGIRVVVYTDMLAINIHHSMYKC